MGGGEALSAQLWWRGALWGLSLCGLCALILWPLPNALLDLGIALSWAIAVGFFTLALNAPALSLPQLPQWLLLMTVGRLMLNIATTRAILSEARAGEFVSALGELVMSGSWLVGLSFFVTLTLIQLIVISRGAERIAEVSARFALDALPSAQQALSHDLDRDALHPEDARRARRLLRARAELCGALDGAMRFVKGEAFASALLTTLNAVGGLLVGVSHLGQAWGEAWARYAPLTIGDGLVAQLPALLYTLGVATLVSRLPLAYSRGAEAQLERSSAEAARLATIAGLTALILLALLPELGWVARLSLATLSLVAALSLRRSWRLWPQAARADEQGDLRLLIHPSALRAIGGAERLSQALSELSAELGLPARLIEIWPEARRLPEGGYLLRLGSRTLSEGAIIEGHFASFVTPPPRGAISALHPVWGLEGWWREVEGGWSAESEPSALAPLDLLCVSCVSARLSDQRESWRIEELWSRLSEAPAALRSAALSPSLSVVSLCALFRGLSRSGVDLRSGEACLEAIALAQLEPSLDAARIGELDTLMRGVRRALGWERLSWGARRLSLGLAGQPSLRAELGYLLIDLDCDEAWSADDWGMVERVMREACAVSPEWVVLCEPARRAQLEQRLAERCRGVAVLSWDELPPELQLEQLGWVQ